MVNSPKITIITVVRNGENHLAQCINSITTQTYKNIEYIIIDGQSVDGTVDIIRNYEKSLTYWISEPDSGIYDAMNKGILASTGEWLLFINSDDYLTDKHVIENAVTYLQAATNLVVYGKIGYITSSGNEIAFGLEWESIRDTFRNRSMLNLCHQATFHSKKLFVNNLYNTKFKIAGDYELLLRYLKNNEAQFIPIEISKMRGGGSSNQNYKNLFLEVCKIHLENKNYKFYLTKYFVSNLLSTYLHHFSNKLLGPNVVLRAKKYFKKNVSQ
jgi:glycosyltransferase involved in cell wall biosynthesis